MRSDHTTQNQIDYIWITKIFTKSMKDVRIRREVDVASEYNLVLAKIKLKPKRHWTTKQTLSQNLNTAFFPHTDKHIKFKTTLNNRLQRRRHYSKEQLKRGKKALASTRQEILCRKKHHHKKCIAIENLRRKQKSRTRRQQSKAAEEVQKMSRHELNTSKQTNKCRWAL